MRTVAIVQARTGSSRFPRKVLADLGGRPMLLHVVARASRIVGVDQVIVATTLGHDDDIIELLCRKMRVACWRGHKALPSGANDVLDRYYKAAIAFEAEVVVRVTADCPLLNPGIASQLVGTFHFGGYDYVANTPDAGTDGWDSEVFSFAALARAWREATTEYDRQHVTPFIRTSGIFAVRHIVTERIPRGDKWSVDTPEDLDRVRVAYGSTEAVA